eukprot:4533045-Pyramimonas_sp.AAC.1
MVGVSELSYKNVGCANNGDGLHTTPILTILDEPARSGPLASAGQLHLTLAVVAWQVGALVIDYTDKLGRWEAFGPKPVFTSSGPVSWNANQTFYVWQKRS